LTCEESLIYVAKMLHLCHDDSEDKRYQLELSWVTDGTDHVHKRVPDILMEQAE